VAVVDEGEIEASQFHCKLHVGKLLGGEVGANQQDLTFINTLLELP